MKLKYKYLFASSWTFRWLFLLLLGSVFFFWRFIPSSEKFTVVPIVDWDAGIPVVEVSVNRHKHQVIFDLGSRLNLMLYEDLAQHGLKHSGYDTFKNLKGVEFKRPMFLASEIRLGSIIYQNRHIISRPKADESSYVISEPKSGRIKPKYLGILGRGLLKDHNILIDISKSRIIICDDISRVQREGYPLKSFTKVPFTLDPKGIILEVETSAKKGRYLLDTGATVTLVHKQLALGHEIYHSDLYGLPTAQSDCFKMNEVDFGPHNLYFIEMSSELDFDGLLGMDFIEKHVMYIDFADSCLYIEEQVFV